MCHCHRLPQNYKILIVKVCFDLLRQEVIYPQPPAILRVDTFTALVGCEIELCNILTVISIVIL